jgi:predicted transcriptional regulator
MTQVELAQKIQSSQPLIDRAENGDASVSIELLIRGMLGTGATLQEIGKVIAESRMNLEVSHAIQIIAQHLISHRYGLLVRLIPIL